MSKTDKTKPWDLRILEHAPRQQHDHRDGVCDLPDLRSRADVGWRGNGHCYWSEGSILYSDQCCYGCGCRICTGYYTRRQERRRERHEAQRLTRSMLTRGELD
jgi:hypothetical protein